MESKQLKRWQVIGSGQIVFYGHDEFGRGRCYHGGDVFEATDDEVESQKHKVVEQPEATPPAEPRDAATAHVMDQEEAQRQRRARKSPPLNRAMREPPIAEVMQ